MILSYKIKHGRDFSEELSKAWKVAEHVLKNGLCSTKHIKHIGLKAVIANQIIRKYGRNKKIKKISNVNLIVPGQSIRNDVENSILNIPCLKLSLPYRFSGFTKINQVEISKTYASIAVTVSEIEPKNPKTWIGVDLNTTGHCCVASNPSTGKVVKFGKKAHHIHKKYKCQREHLQKKHKFNLVRRIKNRESRIVRDLNHKMSRGIVDRALKTNSGIVLEDLSGIRNTKKQTKEFKYSMHSWSFWQLRHFVEYKAKLLGIPVVKIDPAYTSLQCSKCGLLGNRNKKHFKCFVCGNVENADVNASFSIALRHQGILQFPAERDVGKGSTDTPRKATVRRTQTLNLRSEGA